MAAIGLFACRDRGKSGIYIIYEFTVKKRKVFTHFFLLLQWVIENEGRLVNNFHTVMAVGIGIAAVPSEFETAALAATVLGDGRMSVLKKHTWIWLVGAFAILAVVGIATS